MLLWCIFEGVCSIAGCGLLGQGGYPGREVLVCIVFGALVVGEGACSVLVWLILLFCIGDFETQEGMVGKSMCDLGVGARVEEVGIWSGVLHCGFVSGVQSVLVCWLRSCSVDVSVFVQILSIIDSELAVCLVGFGWYSSV